MKTIFYSVLLLLTLQATAQVKPAAWPNQNWLEGFMTAGAKRWHYNRLGS